MDVVDLRGLELNDERRRTAYPRDERIELGRPLEYLHLESTSWYFDASDARNAAEAERVISELCFRAETRAYDRAYRPFRVVIDNYGGTIVGRRRDA